MKGHHTAMGRRDRDSLERSRGSAGSARGFSHRPKQYTVSKRVGARSQFSHPDYAPCAGQNPVPAGSAASHRIVRTPGEPSSAGFNREYTIGRKQSNPQPPGWGFIVTCSGKRRQRGRCRIEVSIECPARGQFLKASAFRLMRR